MQTSSYRNILKAMSLFTGVQGLNIILDIVRAKLAAVLLGPAGIGLHSIYNELRELIHETTNLGLDKSGVREVARAYGERNQDGGAERLTEAISLTRTWILLLALSGAFITLALSMPLSWIFFGDTLHTTDFAILSVAVGMSTMTCGEMTILRGIHRLKTIALVSVLHVVMGIGVTIPIYWAFGIDGVVAAIVLLTMALAAITMLFSYRIHPPRYGFGKAHLGRGRTMILLGISFMLSGIISHASRLVVQGYLNNASSLDMVGYYSSLLTILGYISIIFTSLDTDYFPRLSEVFDSPRDRQETVQRQAMAGTLVMLPISVMLILTMSHVVPLMLSDNFSIIVPACQIMIAGMACKAIYLPTSLMPLAAGDSRLFLLMQTISYTCFIPLIIIGYMTAGLYGIGCGMFAGSTLDMTCIALFARMRYGVSIINRTMLMHLVIAVSTALLCCFATNVLEGLTYTATAAAVIIASLLYSYCNIRKLISRTHA